MPKYFVGIDVSLNTIDICVIDTEQKIIKQKRFTQNKEGFNEIFSLLHTLGNPQDLAIGIESTGNYHINILHFLNKKTYNVTLINPLLIKKFLQSTTLRKTKTDKISAKIIALYLLRNPDKIKKDTTYDTVKLLARECEKLVQEIAKLKNKIKQITFNIFTELTHKYNIFTKTLLEFLLEVPSARCARELGEERITIIINKISQKKGPKLPLTAEEIVEIVNNTISIDDPNREEILKSSIRRLFQLEEEFSRFKIKLINQAKNNYPEQMKILTSIPGIGELTAASFISEIPTINAMPNYKKVIAISGIDPVIQESGKFKGQYKISKHGNRHLRRTLWQITMGTILHTNMFRIYYKRKREEGMKHKKAIIATANKLLRILFTLLIRKTTFCDIPHPESPPISVPIFHS